MALHRVHLMSDVYLVCLTHALSTEKEEIMGLLIGEIDDTRVCCISAVILLRRSDKQADRVEISPEQLSAASTKAENLARELDQPMRVVGWYHSHPHITVWPSHVDVRTQAMYQMLDEGFVGLIFSVFNEKKLTKENQLQATCFQSINQSPEGEPPQYIRHEVPLSILPVSHISRPCLESLANLPRIISQEEEDVYSHVEGLADLDLVSRVHNEAVYSKAMCELMQTMSIPLLHSLENRLARNLALIDELTQTKQELQVTLANENAGDNDRLPLTSPLKITSI